MGAAFEPRPQPWVANISVDVVHSGDFLALSKIRGRWGGFETLEKWVTGSYAGHTSVFLRDSEGKLWVCEAGHENEKGEMLLLCYHGMNGGNLSRIRISPILIIFLPLHPDLQESFNATAAWKYVLSMNGKPYGFHNLIFSWIDTLDWNYPLPLDAHLIASFMTVWNQIQPVCW